LGGHEGLCRCHGRGWWQVTTTTCSETIGRAARGSHHLKSELISEITKSLLQMMTSMIMHNHILLALK
jgi:hypothetical protein